MSLYALEDEILIYAADAIERRTYRCSGCKSAVKVRKGRHRVPHFYHLSLSPSCRLHSKSEDHLIAQLAFQEWLPAGEVVLEKPFADILRVGDVVWEPRRLVFEIQCSLLDTREVDRRTRDYSEMGYQIVWILDDRLFNRPYRLRPAESELRTRVCYYATLRHVTEPRIYDQFEVFHREQRLKRGSRARVHVNDPRTLAELTWDKRHFPEQVLQRAQPERLYFRGDLLHKALLAAAIPALAFSMRNFRALEILMRVHAKALGSPFRCWVRRHLLEPIGRLLLYLHERAAR